MLLLVVVSSFESGMFFVFWFWLIDYLVDCVFD